MLKSTNSMEIVRYGDGLITAKLLRTRLLPNPNALVAASKDTEAVKLCSNEIHQFLTRSAG